MRRRRGFILYIVLTVLFALAILAFALNSFKSGAVVQLSRNIDQNRLALLAQSANAEALARLRTQANNFDSDISKAFRKIFEMNTTSGAESLENYVIFDDFVPEKTLEMSQEEGYPLDVKCKAVLNVYRKAPYKSVSAYNAYIDLYAQANRDGSGEKITIEVHERRDVRITDMRHYLDKYVLFVKNYSPDLNNPHRRIIIEGIPNSGSHISRVYLGNNFYPDAADPQKYIWLDINYNDHNKLNGFKEIFKISELRQFSDKAEKVLFYSGNKVFKDFTNITIDQFFQVASVKHVYENLVNDASNAANEVETKPDKNLVGSNLNAHCVNGMNKLKSKGANSSNSAAYSICEDFVKNVKSNYSDYSQCRGFVQILNNCIMNWKYRYGYLDAENVWKIYEKERPNIPDPKKWVNAQSYRGLSEISDEFNKRGPYVNAYLKEKNGKIYNPERFRIGRMFSLFGEDNKTNVLVEGPVFMRFFKIAFLDEFTDTIEIGAKSDGSGEMLKKQINPEPVPMPTVRLDEDKSFLNTKLGSDLSPSLYYSDYYMMSCAIDTLSVNALIGTNVSFYNGDGKSTSINPITTPAPTFLNALQKTGANVPATSFSRLIDLQTVTYNYPESADFIKSRVAEYNGNKTLFVDGVMFIEKGDLDLSEIHYFYGKGLIYLRGGDCKIGNMQRARNEIQTGDSMRIYLQHGDFRLTSEDPIIIEASLGAFTYPMGSDLSSQGSLVFNGQSQVKIFGNLLVDYLYTQDTGSYGLKKDGKLIVQHDPFIYEPAAKIGGIQQDPYHVSIGPVRTSFAINAGGKSF
ncbi:MAG: hypothetical protein PHF29_10180 [Candidatus Riflebacteria bacterium]|nr:hypothetical protein [Candidatus Riflebacteria bacterium]